MMIWGKLYVEEVASMARESACVFLLLGMCCRLNESNFDCKCLTWLRYPCIILSLASSSPPTWPTTSFESENIFTAFPPTLWIMGIPSNKASYSTSLFVAKKPYLNDFSMVSFSGETRTSPTLNPLWFAALSTCTFQCNISCGVIDPTDFPSMRCASISFSYGVSTNSATKSTRTWPLTEVWGMYLISKAPRIVPHFTTLLVKLALRSKALGGIESEWQQCVLGSNGGVCV